MNRQRPTLALLGQLLGSLALAPLLLSMAGLVLAVIGAYVTWGLGPAILAAAVACFVLEWRLSGDEPEPVDARPARAYGPDGYPL